MEHIQITPQSVANAIQELLDENDKLKARLGECVQYQGVPQRYVIGGHMTGPNRPNAKKLTRSEVAHIRQLKRSGWKQSALAEIYDVNPATISRIVRGQYHK